MLCTRCILAFAWLNQLKLCQIVFELKLNEVFELKNADADESDEYDTSDINNITQEIPIKCAVHFMCDLRSNTLQLLTEAIETYAQHFIQMSINLTQNTIIDMNDTATYMNVINNHNTNPLNIIKDISNLKSAIIGSVHCSDNTNRNRNTMNDKLQLEALNIYVTIECPVYYGIYFQIIQLFMDDKYLQEYIIGLPSDSSSSAAKLSFEIGIFHLKMFQTIFSLHKK